MKTRLNFLLVSCIMAFSSNSFAQYCDASGPACSTGGNTWITQVDVSQGFINSSGCAGGYSDFTNKTIIMYLDSTYTLNVTESGIWPADVASCWIDLNKDGDFGDTGEEFTMAGNAATFFSGAIVIATGSATTGVTRLRTRLYDGSADIAPGPCDNTSFGEVEDYTVIILDANTNSAPIANNDNATTPEATPVTVNVAVNDMDPDGTIVATTVAITIAPTQGTATVNATDGKITYIPTGNFFGSDSLSYTVKDNDNATSNAAKLYITVTDVPNLNPIALNDSAETNMNVAVTVDNLENDTDADGEIDSTSVVLVQTPSHGAAVIDAITGKITYTPTAGYFGTDTLTYTVNDKEGATSNVDTVSFKVMGVSNNSPVAVNDVVETSKNTLVVIDELDNDTDSDGSIDPTSVVIIVQPKNGTAVVNATSGEITYTPTTNYLGADSIDYTVEDLEGAVSNTARIHITVTENANEAPIANDDSVITDKNTALTINVLANDSDPDGTIDPATLFIEVEPKHGTAVINNGKIDYTPTTDFFGVDSILYIVKDNKGKESLPPGLVYITVEDKVGIRHLIINELKIYPNPAQEKITISSDRIHNGATVMVKLFDNSGRLITNEEMIVADGKIEFTLGQLAEGIYTLSLQQGNELFSSRITIIK